MPLLEEVYDDLSTIPDIRVYAESKDSIHRGDVQRDVSEKELIDNLMEFLDRVRGVPLEGLNEREREIVKSADTFASSMNFLTHEAYKEAIDGLALHHVEWLREDDSRNLRIVAQRNRQYSSQWAIANDLKNSIMVAASDLNDRVDVKFIGELNESLKDNTKLILPDDWSVSGHLIYRDVSHVYQVFEREGISADVEINLLVARENQVKDGIHTLKYAAEDNDNEHDEPTIVGYFQAAADEGTYAAKPMPTGSHSSVDYGFSATLDRMLNILNMHTPSKDSYMPYVAKIIPRYAHNYEA